MGREELGYNHPIVVVPTCRPGGFPSGCFEMSAHFLADSRPYEVRWHGRGGQGAVTAARTLAQAAHHGGYRGATASPSFGAERRGAPVTASTRISLDPIMVVSQIESPDMVVVLDQTLLRDREVVSGLRSGGWLVVNSARPPAQLGVIGDFSVATADATGICRELGLTVSGLIVVNTAMLGAVARVSDLVTPASIDEVIRNRFSNRSAELNLAAVERTRRATLIERRP